VQAIWWSHDLTGPEAPNATHWGQGTTVSPTNRCRPRKRHGWRTKAKPLAALRTLTALQLNRPTPRSKQIVLTVAGELQPCRRKSNIEVVPIGGRPEQSRGLNLEFQRWHCRGLSFSLLSFFALERSLADADPPAASLSESPTKQKRHFVLSVTGTGAGRA